MVAKFDQYIRWDFIGLSTDTKPTPATSEDVTDGSTYYEVNTSKLYVWCKDNWYEKEDTGGGGGGSTPQIKTLTSADVNYPIDEPTRISLALLPEGIYTTDDSVQVCLGKQTAQIQNMYAGEVAFVMPRNDGTTATDIYLIRRSYGITTAIGNNANGTASAIKTLPTQVIDNLTSVDTEAALSAAQGKVLNEKINVSQLPLTVDLSTGTISTTYTCQQVKTLVDAGNALLPFATLSDGSYVQGGIASMQLATTNSKIYFYAFEGEGSSILMVPLTAPTTTDVFTGTFPM